MMNHQCLTWVLTTVCYSHNPKLTNGQSLASSREDSNHVPVVASVCDKVKELQTTPADKNGMRHVNMCICYPIQLQV